MTTLVLAALLMHQSGAAQGPAITLRLLAPEKPVTKAAQGNGDAQLEALAASATPSGRKRPVDMSVIVKANRMGDVWVDRNALRLEIRGLDGAPLNSKCIVDRHGPLEPRRRDEVRLRAGQTMKIALRVGQSAAGVRGAVCFGPNTDPGRRLGVIAVYDPADPFPFQMQPRNGATPLTKHVESNLIAIGSLDSP